VALSASAAHALADGGTAARLVDHIESLQASLRGQHSAEMGRPAMRALELMLILIGNLAIRLPETRDELLASQLPGCMEHLWSICMVGALSLSPSISIFPPPPYR
jgi:hypothetical protein